MPNETLLENLPLASMHLAVFVLLPSTKDTKRNDENVSSKEKELISISDALEPVITELLTPNFSKPLDTIKDTVLNYFYSLCSMKIADTSYEYFSRNFDKGNNCTQSTLLLFAIRLQFDIYNYFFEEEFNDFLFNEE